MEDWIEHFLVYFLTDTFQFVLHLFWVFQVHDWLLIPSKIILQAILTAIKSFLTILVNKARFCYGERGPIDTKSYTSFLMNIDFVIMDYISQLAKSVSFLRLAWPLELLFSDIVAVGLSLLGSLVRERWSEGFFCLVFVLLYEDK